MSANVIPFIYNDKPVRSVEREGEPWFVGKDVCGVLDIIKHHQALDRLDADERDTCSVGTPSGQQEMIIISEAGVYRLVFSSRKKEAEDFKRWLAHEVLPSLRRTGKYAVHQPEAEPLADEPTQRLNAKIGLIREARVLFGPERAKKLWGALGLPDVPAMPAPRSENEEARACLLHFLNHEMANGRTARANLQAAMGDRSLCKWLEDFGILLRFKPHGFLLANTADYVESCFRYTEFEGQWRGLLRTLPDVSPDIGRFAGQGSRATFIPWRYLEGIGALIAA